MNYRVKLKENGFEIFKTSTLVKNKTRNISYTIVKNGKRASFKTLKEAFDFIDFF